MRVATILPLLLLPGAALAGHTRPGYVDAGQTADGRYVVTARPPADGKKPGPWTFTWKDTKTGATHEGKLVGLPYGLDHFRVAYAHVFVPPGGEVFAVWQTANWAAGGSKPPGPQCPKSPSGEFKDYAGFADRLVIYKRTGEVVKRLAMKDILKDNEWLFVNWVQGNLYWLREYDDVMKGGEPPRCGYRYYRVSLDYSVLEFAVGPNSDAKHKVKDEGPAAVNYRRAVRVSLVDGTFLDPAAKLAKEKEPVRPFVGPLSRRGEAMKAYVPSLDPVRVPGK